MYMYALMNKVLYTAVNSEGFLSWQADHIPVKIKCSDSAIKWWGEDNLSILSECYPGNSSQVFIEGNETEATACVPKLHL